MSAGFCLSELPEELPDGLRNEGMQFSDNAISRRVFGSIKVSQGVALISNIPSRSVPKAWALAKQKHKDQQQDERDVDGEDREDAL